MSIRNSIAYATSLHGEVHIWHEHDVESIDELHDSEDIFLQVSFGRIETTHRIPMGIFRILVPQIASCLPPNAPDNRAP